MPDRYQKKTWNPNNWHTTFMQSSVGPSENVASMCECAWKITQKKMEAIRSQRNIEACIIALRKQKCASAVTNKIDRRSHRLCSTIYAIPTRKKMTINSSIRPSDHSQQAGWETAYTRRFEQNSVTKLDGKTPATYFGAWSENDIPLQGSHFT